jgi:hypothetical protein
MLVVWTPNDLLEVGVPSYLGLVTPWYIYGSANLVGRPGMRDLPRSVCFCKPCQPALDTKEFCVGNEGLSVGCAPDGPAKRFWVLG